MQINLKCKCNAFNCFAEFVQLYMANFVLCKILLDIFFNNSAKFKVKLIKMRAIIIEEIFHIINKYYYYLIRTKKIRLENHLLSYRTYTPIYCIRADVIRFRIINQFNR